MYCTKFRVVTLLGVGIFLVGTACFVAVTLHSVFPAREEQKLKEINCTIVSDDMDLKVKCSHKKRDETSYPCRRIYVLCGNKVKRNGSLEEVQRRLLLKKDFHSRHKKCTFEPDECMEKSKAKSLLIFGSAFRAYYHPKDPELVVHEKATQESYNKLVIHSVVWPLGIIILGIVVIAAAACLFTSRRRKSYEQIPGVSSSPLQQSL